MKAIFLISVAILMFASCGLEEASIKDFKTPEAVIDITDDEFVVVKGDEGSELNKFIISKEIDYYTLSGLSSDITKYNKSHIKAIECTAASLTISTEDGKGTMIYDLDMSTDSPDALTFSVPEYTLGAIIRNADTKQYAENIGMDIINRDKVTIIAKGKTDAPAGTHFNVNITLEDVTVRIAIAN
jgi:ABC-type oligopeptide transport system substrate-binding subunit